MLGSSGVGKSSLANRLLGEEAQPTKGLAEDGTGRHTTVAAIALPLPDGRGWVVDTPGVRSFGLAHVTPDDVPAAFDDLAAAIEDTLGVSNHVPVPQSLGGEDFAWYLESVPGAMGRLGNRTRGGPTYDLHQGDLVVDDGATAVGSKVLAAVALEALSPDVTGR